MSQCSVKLSYCLRSGKFTMIAILAGSTINTCLQTICPNNIPKGTQNMHFFKFKEIWYCLHVSSISLKLPICFLSNPNTIQSSNYTYRNLWIYSLKFATNTLENIVGAFFSPKGINVYWYEPHSVAKVVLCRSSGVILIWWYPKNLSVNE